MFLVAISRFIEGAHQKDCIRKYEEGAGNARSVCLESARLHAARIG